jgi:hypothetical protein
MTTIRSSAFDGCSNLTGFLTIPPSVTSIGNSAFYGCSGLSGSLTIPPSVTSISYGAFRDCSGLSGSLTIPPSVTSIGGAAFNGCSGLSGIPPSVTSIGNSAFYGCSGFTSAVTFPNSVATLGVLESRSGTKESSALRRQSLLIIYKTRDEVSRPLPYSSLTLSFRNDDSHVLHRQLLSSLLRLRPSVVIGFHSHQMRVNSVGDRILGVQPHDPQHSWRSLRVVARESLE